MVLRPTFVIAVMVGLGCDGGGGGNPDSRVDGAPRVDGSKPDARADGLGEVANVPGACGNGNLPRTMCQLLRVQCTGVPDRQVEIRITDPPVGTPRIGTVALGTGGGGGSYYEADPMARAMMLDLSAAGYRLIQRQWIGSNGWIGGPGGFPAVACRYATLLQYFYEQIHLPTDPFGDEAFCATGNSGGASEIAYALAHWNRGQILELALPTGGPPMGRLDHGCLDAADPTWQAECAALVPPASSTCVPGPACSYSANAAMLIDSAYGGTDCASSNDSFRPTLLAHSAAAPGELFDYPTTRVHFLFGADDCTEAVPLGLAFAAQITSTKTIEFVPNTPHAVFSTLEGSTKIRDTILAECVP